jgi:DNA-binding transcriptional regulator YiaG
MRGAALAVKVAIDPANSREGSHEPGDFALALNVPKMLLSKWERGETRLSGPSLKLFALVDTKGIDAIR